MSYHVGRARKGSTRKVDRSHEAEASQDWRAQWKNDNAGAVKCVRLRELSATLPDSMRMDKKAWDPREFQANWKQYSPIVEQLLARIEDIDAEDVQQAEYAAQAQGRQRAPGEGLHKHLIYVPCDEKEHMYGPQLVMGAFGVEGWTIRRFVKDRSGWGLERKSRGYGEEDAMDEERRTVAMMTAYPFSSRVFVAGRSAGSKESESDRKLMSAAVIREWNAKDNVNGERLRVCVIDQGSGTGLDFKNTKYIHFVGKPTSQSSFMQVVARAARFCGHGGELYDSVDGYTVKVFIYVGVDENDELLYDYTLTTKPYDVAGQNMLQFLKETAVDRDLNALLVGNDPNTPSEQEQVIEQLGIPM